MVTRLLFLVAIVERFIAGRKFEVFEASDQQGMTHAIAQPASFHDETT